MTNQYSAGECGFRAKNSAPHVCKICDRPIDHHKIWDILQEQKENLNKVPEHVKDFAIRSSYAKYLEAITKLAQE